MTARILVVEDDLLNRMFYHEVLDACGHEVAMVGDGAAVMGEVERFRPHVITMDIQLPHVSGLKLIGQLRRRAETREIPIIAITAFAGREEEARVRAAGASNYLAKPVTMDRLKSAVNAALGG
jgi:two-component system cell cycle response regulator DivK